VRASGNERKHGLRSAEAIAARRKLLEAIRALDRLNAPPAAVAIASWERRTVIELRALAARATSILG
jgi:hypothetical protein